MLVLLHLVRWCWLTPKYPQVSSFFSMTRSLRETKSRDFCFWHLFNITQDPWKPLDRRNSQEELQPKDPKVLEKSARPREKTRGPSWGDVRRKLGFEVKKLKGKLIEMFEPPWHKVWSCSHQNEHVMTCLKQHRIDNAAKSPWRFDQPMVPRPVREVLRQQAIRLTESLEEATWIFKDPKLRPKYSPYMSLSSWHGLENPKHIHN